MAINVKALRAAGLTDAQIVAVFEKAEELRNERNRERQAAFQARKRAKASNANNADNVSNVNNVIPVTESDPSRACSNTNLPTGDIYIPPIVPPEQETAPRKARRAPARFQISEDARPTDRDRDFGRNVGMTGDIFDQQWRKFVDYHRAKGSLMADWSAAWRTWCGNFPSFAQPRGSPQAGFKSPVQSRGEWVLESSDAGKAWLARYPGTWKSRREERNGEWGAMMPSRFPPANAAA